MRGDGERKQGTSVVKGRVKNRKRDKIHAADVIGSVQGTDWVVIICYSLIRTLNQSCLATPHKFNMPLQSG